MRRASPIICINCGKEHYLKNKKSCRGIYCSQKCQHAYTRKIKIKAWLEDKIPITKDLIKRYLIEQYGNKCFSCGITEWNNKPIVMDLEHIDGNSENDNIENLELLCPNCHSQTPTYKGANKGNGRYSRRQRYVDGKSY